MPATYIHQRRQLSQTVCGRALASRAETYTSRRRHSEPAVSWAPWLRFLFLDAVLFLFGALHFEAIIFVLGPAGIAFL